MSDTGDNTTPVPDVDLEDDPAVIAAVEAAVAAAMAAARAEAFEKARKARELEKARRAAEEKRVAEARRIAEEREREEVEEVEGEEETGDVGEATMARAAKGKGKAAMNLGYVLFYLVYLNLVTNTFAVGWCATDVARKDATTATGRRRRSAERAAALMSPVRWVGKVSPGVPVQRSPGLRSGRGSRRRCAGEGGAKNAPSSP
jgi:hypothetical protein